MIVFQRIMDSIQRRMFPRFPSVHDTPPSSEDIRASEPYLAYVLWLGCLLLIVSHFPSIWMRMGSFEFIPAFILVAFLVILIMGTLTFLSMQMDKFQIIGEGKSASRWSCEKADQFFKEHPEWDDYRREVHRQGRQLYVGEMDALLQNSMDLQKSHICESLYGVSRDHHVES